MNKLICGDAAKLLGGIAADSVDLSITSPPYDNLFELGDFDVDEIADQLFRITKPGGLVAWQVQDRIVRGSESCTSAYHKLRFRESGWRCHETLIAETNGSHLPFASFRYPRCWSHVFIFSKGKPKTFNPIMDRKNTTAGQPLRKCIRSPTSGRIWKSKGEGRVPAYGARWNVWRFNSGYGSTTMDDYAYEHPALMPELLAADLITSYSNPGDLVCDPFAGAGTTLKQAILADRRWLGIEINPEFVRIARQRVRDATKGRQKAG